MEAQEDFAQYRREQRRQTPQALQAEVARLTKEKAELEARAERERAERVQAQLEKASGLLPCPSSLVCLLRVWSSDPPSIDRSTDPNGTLTIKIKSPNPQPHRSSTARRCSGRRAR